MQSFEKIPWVKLLKFFSTGYSGKLFLNLLNELVGKNVYSLLLAE
jgi:hypothetical protein